MMRFKLDKSITTPNGWVLTDTKNMVVVTFIEHRFNDTQKVTMLNDITTPDALSLARIMREMGDYMRANHEEICF